MRDYSLIYLNGVRKEVRGREALLMLADWLRKEVGLTGTKIVCAEGDCGACTVLRAFPKFKEAPLHFEAMNSCIATVAQMDGSHLVTIEGIQNGKNLSPMQKAMRECHGSQCGYCTPGFVMALMGALEKHSSLDAKTACNYLTGNLCRCTGYQPIIDAALKAKATDEHSVSKRYLKTEATRDLIYHQKEPLQFQWGQTTFCAPVSLAEAVQFADAHPGFRVVGAATDMGVQTNKGKPLPKALLSLHLIPGLYEIRKEDSRIVVGARVSLSRLRREAQKTNPEFASYLDLFASPQIKNVATLVGNVATGSPIGDTLPFLMVSDGKVHVASFDSKQKTVQTRDISFSVLFEGYRKLAIQPNEIITHISFESTPAERFLKLYKVSQRKDLDISTVSGAFLLKVSPTGKNKKIEELRIAFGGVAATPVRLGSVEKALQGKELSVKIFEEGADLIGKTIQPLTDLRGTHNYRKVLAMNLFKKYGSEVLRGQ
ncbi:MAG: FAD binding domain-containing protein [Pseudomonadota bacterium]